MKRISIIFFFMVVGKGVMAQNPAITPEADQIANHIANKIKDTLNLTLEERNTIYNKNVLVIYRKDSVRQIHPIGSDSLRIRLQSIERRRDSLYRPVLGEVRFQLYLQKKNNLISAN